MPAVTGQAGQAVVAGAAGAKRAPVRTGRSVILVTFRPAVVRARAFGDLAFPVAHLLLAVAACFAGNP